MEIKKLGVIDLIALDEIKKDLKEGAKEGVERAKVIEDLAKETEDAVKELDKQSELLSHPESIPIPLEEAFKTEPEILEEQTLKSEMSLKQLKEKLDKLKEKLKEYKDPKTRSDLIAEVVVEETAVADAEKTIEKAYEAIGRFDEAFYKFKEYYSRWVNNVEEEHRFSFSKALRINKND